jgi:hypothetical protein
MGPREFVRDGNIKRGAEKWVAGITRAKAITQVQWMKSA